MSFISSTLHLDEILSTWNVVASTIKLQSAHVRDGDLR